MNHLHLQEAAKHYAKLAEEAQKNLEQEQELNEDLLTIIEALCEELGIDVEELLSEDLQTVAREEEMKEKIKKAKKGTNEKLKDDLKEIDSEEKSDIDHVYGKGGKRLKMYTSTLEKKNKEMGRKHY